MIPFFKRKVKKNDLIDFFYTDEETGKEKKKVITMADFTKIFNSQRRLLKSQTWLFFKAVGHLFLVDPDNEFFNTTKDMRDIGKKCAEKINQQNKGEENVKSDSAARK